VAELPVPGSGIDGRTGLATTIPLGSVATIRAGIGPQSIERASLERQVSISAGVLPGFGVGDVAVGVQAAIDSMGLPAGYRTVFGGDVQNLNETKGFVAEALILAVVFIYLILASLFGSFFQPLAIMLSLPLSFIGVALALLATKGSLNVMTMIGIIMLLGLVTKNGILLVDFANQRREQGDDMRTALLASARIRLRPIIMTTVAMIAGMLPLAFALGAGAEQRAPMGRAVIGGLITSTLLTLFVVPSVYSLLDDAIAVVRRRFHGSVAAHPGASNPTPVAGD
jgi:HAE1 family hydrophobic/amphiphilic exporter-1